MLRAQQSRTSLPCLSRQELQPGLSPWLAWEVMAQYNCLASCHTRLQKRLNGATISALKKAVRSLEEQRKGVKDLGNYLAEIAIFSLQIEENIETLLDNSNLLRLEEHQISQLHKMLGRVKTLLEWKRPNPQTLVHTSSLGEMAGGVL